MKKTVLFIPALLCLLLSSCGDEANAPTGTDPMADSAGQAHLKIQDSILSAQSMQTMSEMIGNCLNSSGAPQPKKMNWQLPGPPEDLELTICGTWTAALEEYGLRSIDVIVLGDTNSGKSGMGALFDAALHGQRADQRCEWIEFYDDHSGFWNSCALENGSVVSLDYVETTSGDHSASGLKFDWYMSGDTIHLNLENCLKYSLPCKDTLLTAHVKYWDIIVSPKKKKQGSKVIYTVTDYFPEYDYKSPHTYTFIAGKDSDRKKRLDYQKPPMN